MALYNLISMDQAFGQANNNYSGDDPSLRLYNLLNGKKADAQYSTDDNFFSKKAKSLENAFGTTGAAVVDLFNSGLNGDGIESRNNEKRQKEAKQSLDDIAKKYGYNSKDEYWDASNEAEKEIFGKYGFDSDAYWNKHEQLWTPANKDSQEVKDLEATRQDVINRMSQEDADKIRKFDSIASELQGQTKTNADVADKAAKDWKDYRENSYVGKKTNQDRGKFLGSSINTLSTMSDVLLPGAGVALNTVQGGVEGIADELEQSGFKNFNWERAGQNALIGATTGAVTGGLNKGISNQLAKNGGNLFKGGNALARGLNNLGSKTAVGRVGSTLATGAARGAVSGAVGGATGAGLSAAMNGQDVLGSALQGAVQGAQQGATTGGIMAGANMALSKTPGVGNMMRQLNEAGEDWNNRKARGEDFNQRLTGTLTSGDSAVGEWLQGNRQSRLLNRAGQLGNTIIMEDGKPKPFYHGSPVKGIEEFDISKAGKNTRSGEKAVFFTDDLPTADEFSYERIPTDDMFVDNRGDKGEVYTRNLNLENPLNLGNLTDSQIDELWNYAAPIAKMDGKEKFVKNMKDFSQAGNDQLIKSQLDLNLLRESPYDGIIAKMYPGQNDVREYGVFDTNKIINPESASVRQTPTTLGGWLKKAGQRVVEDANNRGVGLNIKDVANENQTYTDDIRNMKINQNDMLGYTDDNTEPITVEEALRRAGVNPAQKAPSMEQPIAEEVEAPTNDQNPQTQLYDALTSNKSSAESKLRNAAGLKLQQQYGTIDKPTANATNAPETLQKIAKIGFTKPGDVERMADIITGSNGEVSKLVSNLVKTAKPVDTFAGDTNGQSLNDYIDFRINRRGLDGINEGKAVKSQIDAIMKSLPSRAEGSINFNDNPEDVFKITQILDAEAANYEGKSGMNYGTTTPDKLRAAQVIKDVSSLLKDRIYDTADVKQALTPDVAENLKSYDPNNKDYANWVDNEIMQAQSIADLRKVQAPWVRAKKIIDNGYMNSITYGGRNGGNGSPIPLTKKGLIGMALGATVNSNPGLRAQAKALNKAADIAGKNQGGEGGSIDNNATTAPQVGTNPNYNPQTRLYDVIGRTEGLINAEQARTASYLADAAQEAEVVPNTSVANIGATIDSMQSTTPATNANTASTALYNTINGTQQTNMPTYSSTEEEKAVYFFPPTGDYWSDMLSRAMRRAKNAEDYDAMASLYEMYQDATGKNSKQSAEKDYSNPVNWSSADRKSLLEAQNGLDQINSLENVYYNAVGEGGGNAVQGTLRSWANNISGGNLDPSASNYVQKANSLGAGIIKNLINLGSTEHDAKRYIEYLPQLTDTKEQAAQKLQDLRNAYENVIRNLQAVYNMQ